MPSVRITQGMGVVFARRFYLTNISSARERRPPAGISKHPALDAIGIHHRPDGEALQQAAPGDVVGQFADGDACLDPADVAAAQKQPVEGDITRGAEGDFLVGSLSYVGAPRRAPRASLSTSYPPRNPAQPSASFVPPPAPCADLSTAIAT